MHASNRNNREFYVVQFIELPYEDIPNYVCVPRSWLIIRRFIQKAVVAYPNDEDPFDTRDRVQRKESYDKKWRFYVATVQYETDTYTDAELWIATRNDYGSSVEDESKIIEMQSRFTMNEKLRSDNQRNSIKVRDKSIKRPVSAPKKQLDNKRFKLNGAGCSNQHQSIIMPENQSMEYAQTEETAVVSSKLVGQLKPTQEPLVSKAPSIEIPRNDQELRTDNVSNDEPTSDHLPNSLKNAASIYSYMKGARRLVPIGEPVEKTIRPMNINRKLAIAVQNPSNLVNQVGFVSTHSEKQQSSVVAQNHSYDGQRVLEIDENQLKQSTESHNQHNRSNSQSIKMRIPSIGENSTNPLYQDSTLLQQKQQSQRPKIRNGISIRPKTNRHQSNLQGVSKNRPPPILTRVLNSLHQTLNTPNYYLLNKQPEETSRSEKLPVTENPLHIMENARQTDEITVEETGSPYYSVTSDSDYSTEEEKNSNKDICGDNELVETTKKAYRTGIDSRNSSVVRPTSKQTSTSKNYQMQPKLVLEQELLYKFKSLFIQMGSILRSTSDMFNNLRSTIMESAVTYKQLLNAMERVEASKNPTSKPSPSSNQTQGVFYATEEKNLEEGVAARACPSNKNEHSNNGAEQTPNPKLNNLRRFVLPPEYDPNDTRWTLKYQYDLPGLVELMPHSRIYVSFAELKYCKYFSKNCESLARRLLSGVFNRKALSVCSSMNEIAQTSNNVSFNPRPELDAHATTALVNFVTEYGLQQGWKIDLQPILNSLNKKIGKIRLKYGVMVQC